MKRTADLEGRETDGTGHAGASESEGEGEPMWQTLLGCGLLAALLGAALIVL